MSVRTADLCHCCFVILIVHPFHVKTSYWFRALGFWMKEIVLLRYRTTFRREVGL